MCVGVFGEYVRGDVVDVASVVRGRGVDICWEWGVVGYVGC